MYFYPRGYLLCFLMRIKTLIIVASEVCSSRAKADRGTHLPGRWFFGLSTKKGPRQIRFYGSAGALSLFCNVYAVAFTECGSVIRMLSCKLEASRLLDSVRAAVCIELLLAFLNNLVNAGGLHRILVLFDRCVHIVGVAKLERPSVLLIGTRAGRDFRCDVARVKHEGRILFVALLRIDLLLPLVTNRVVIIWHACLVAVQILRADSPHCVGIVEIRIKDCILPLVIEIIGCSEDAVVEGIIGFLIRREQVSESKCSLRILGGIRDDHAVLRIWKMRDVLVEGSKMKIPIRMKNCLS